MRVGLFACVLLISSSLFGWPEWFIEEIDSDGDVGIYSSCVVLWAAHYQVAYYDSLNGNLKLASSVDGWEWLVHTVDSEGNVGMHTSIINSNIAYYDATNGNLKFMETCPITSGIEIVDSIGDVGQFASIDLALGSENDYPCISYYDATNGDLRLAWRDETSSQWCQETVDSTGNVGLYSSLDATFYTYCISYYDKTNGDLKFACRTYGSSPSEWEIITVDSIGDVGRHSSVSRTGSDRWCVSYYDSSKGDLKLAELEESIWTISTVDSIGDVGMYSSLAMQGYWSQISYYDATNSSLKIAHWVDMGVEGHPTAQDIMLQLFPNPSYGAFYACFEFQDSMKAEFLLYGTGGRIVKHIAPAEYSTDPQMVQFNDLVPGVYLLRIVTDDLIGSSKIVVLDR